MTTPSDVLREMFAHHLWATERLVDHLGALPEGRLDEAVPGTYGSMISTLTHLVDADSRYLVRLDDPSPAASEDRAVIPLAALRDELADHRRRWEAALEALGSGELHAEIRSKDDYPDTPDAEGLLLLQAIHHGNDHRTQICSTLGALGLDVPDLDGWTYWAERPGGASRCSSREVADTGTAGDRGFVSQRRVGSMVVVTVKERT